MPETGNQHVLGRLPASGGFNSGNDFLPDGPWYRQPTAKQAIGDVMDADGTGKWAKGRLTSSGIVTSSDVPLPA
jgi:hypothetical protein